VRTRLLAPFAVLVALLSLPTLSSASAADVGCARWALEASCSTSPARIIVGDPFTATVTVRNAGDQTLTKVSIQIRGNLNSHPANNVPVEQVVEKLEPGETKQLSGSFICDVVGLSRIVGGARDEPGWAAANCACTVEIIGLPAIQSEMSDKDLQGAEKGIFKVGEEFLYTLTVQNDAGTTVTPDLKVVFSLPKELEFVSGTGDGSVKVTGEGQSATSSTFVLTPNQAMKITITVKSIGIPGSNLAQTKASIQTASGIEVAEETESTTLK
jgi:uncharacterized repeat protein (TIGR01451 family)